MKTFDSLYDELKIKVNENQENSRTVTEFNLGTHGIGKKIVEEAAEVWMAAEYESKENLVSEISQLIYHIEVMMLKHEITPNDVYQEL